MSYDIPPDVLALPISAQDLRQTPKPVIVNVVATYDLWHSFIDAETLTTRLPGFGYNPQRFAAIKMRMGRAMTLAFCGGRAVCPGARRVMDARVAALRFTGMLLDADEMVCFRRFRVQNIVCSCQAPFELELANIIREYSGSAEYKTDKFPGLSLRMNSPPIVFNIFVTGQVVITGSKDYEHSVKAWWWLYTHVLVRHRRGTAARSTSSAAYKMHTQRDRDTLAADCDRLAGTHARRADGPLARSEYADLLRTPRNSLSCLSTPVATPPSWAGPSPGGAASAAQGVRALLVRMEQVFQGHTIHCSLVRGAAEGPAADSDAAAEPFWRDQLRGLECALAGVDAAGLDMAAVLDPHHRAGCIGIGVLRDRNRLEEAAQCFIGQIHLALQDDPGPPDAQPQPAPAAHVGPVSAMQPLEVEDVLNIEAQHHLDMYRACVARAGETVEFCGWTG